MLKMGIGYWIRWMIAQELFLWYIVNSDDLILISNSGKKKKSHLPSVSLLLLSLSLSVSFHLSFCVFFFVFDFIWFWRPFSPFYFLFFDWLMLFIVLFLCKGTVSNCAALSESSGNGGEEEEREKEMMMRMMEETAGEDDRNDSGCWRFTCEIHPFGMERRFWTSQTWKFHLKPESQKLKIETFSENFIFFFFGILNFLLII